MADNTIAKAYVQIIPTTKGITNTLNKELGGSADAAGESAGKSFSKKLVGAVAKIGIGAAIGKVIKQSLSEGAELQQNLGGTEAVFGDFAKSIQASATEAYKNMGLSASDYMATANKMGSLFQGSGIEQSKAMDLTAQAMQRAADVASVMGIDTESAMESIAGAAKGNFTMMDNLGVAMNATTLQAYALEKGVNFDWNTASNAEKSQLAMQMFFDKTSQYAGNFARESSETLSGSMGAVKSAFQNVLGNLALGEDITPSLNALSSTVTTFITGNLMPMVSNVISALPQALSTMLTTLAPTLIPVGVDILTNLLDGISSTIPTLVETIIALIPTIVDQLINGLPQIIDSGIKILMSLIDGIINSLPQLISAMPKIITSFVNVITTNLPKIISSGVTLLTKLIEGIIKTIPTLVKNIPKIISALVNGLKQGIGSLREVGQNLVSGLWNGISDMISWVLSKIRGFGQTILNGIKNIFGIHSPSTETAWMGDMLMQGLANGIDDNAKKAVNSMKNAADSALGAVDTGAFSFNASGKYSVNGASGNGGVNNITLNVYGAQGQDVRELANIVMSEIQSATERRVAAFA